MSIFGVRGQDSSSEFFFRVTDRLQMESCLTAMVKDGKSIVISSDSNELIDHYGAAFVRRVKQQLPQSKLEVFLPRDTDAMLERFNQLLNTLSLDVATKFRGEESIDRVWVIHDANAMGAHEIQLLTRLIQQFPGAGICVVLMFTKGNAQADAITSQNRQFISWLLELPTAEQKLAAIQQARKNGQEQEAVDFFNHLSKSNLKSASKPSQSAPSSSPPQSPSSKKAASSPTLKVAKPMALTIVGIGLLAISVGVSFGLNPDVGDQVISQVASWVKGDAPKRKDNASEAKDEASTASNTSVASAKDAAAGPNLTQLEPKVELVDTPSTPPQAQAAPTTAIATSSASPSATTQPAPAEPQVAAKVITELPEAAIQGRLWLKSLPTDAYVLEHKNFATVKEARAYMKDKEWLANARIAPVFAEGKDEARFAVMTGHFRSVERAKNTIVRLKLPTDVTITSVQMATKQAQASKPKP